MNSPYAVVLIDASGYLFRAYHALPKLTNSQGEATGALIGVLNMLRKLIDETAPEYIGVVFDAPGPTFRDALYPDYKAQRPPMPDELREQLEPLKAIIRAMGLPLLEIPEVEADDVIGTLATRAADQGLSTLISTGDKDMAQLVDARITLINTMSGTVLDPEGVKAKFGVPPARIIDYLSLMGDSSDNIPGVPKCGPKTAVKWIEQYGDLDGVISHAEAIKGKVGEHLRAALDQLPLARQLTTIKRDVELELAPTDLRPSEPDRETLRSWYERIESKRLLATLNGDAGTRTGGAAGTEHAGAAGSAAGGLEGGLFGDLAVGGPLGSAGAADENGGGSSTTGEHGLGQPQWPTAAAPQQPEADYQTILAQAEFDDWLELLRQAELIAFDTETNALDYMRAEIVGVSVAVSAHQAAYIPLAHDYPGAPDQLDREQVLSALKPLLEDAERPKLGQNLKFDMSVCARAGIELRGLAHDSMLQSYVLDSTATRHDMDSLAKKYLDEETITFETIAGKGAKQLTFDQIPLETAAPYAAEDADITLRLHRTLWPRIEALPGLTRVYREIEMPLVPVLSRIERTGVRVDVDELKAQSRDLAERAAELEERAYAEAGSRFNMGSPKQIGAIFFEQLKLPVVAKTPKGAPSTSEAVLEKLAEDGYELPRLILEHRGVTKLRSTYTDKLPLMVHPETGRVHTSYHQAVAATGRLSSSDPNLQNIPIRSEAGRRIRRAFVPEPGFRMLAADYSQIELRIMAHLSGDERLLAAFAAGQDIHRATAAEILSLQPEEVTGEQRRSAKAINFGLIYGMSAFGLARQLGIERQEAQDYVDAYFARYPGVRAFMDKTREQARQDRYVETLFGRRLYLTNIGHSNHQLRSAAERTAINAPMQGTAADIIKRAMIQVDAWIRREQPPVRMIMQVHDELVFEVAEGATQASSEQICALMQDAAELAVPLLVEAGVGDNWEEAH
ncbi:DNA polymerase I [Halochromatium salexigens]|uniref:DNA polymerase I n=1 Tax=Halochromatium salexigens TaxID=49447 RepID=A0AAJ0UG02_HALSE|nr:DNA polymerase I [Halochromatium salexigens]MBK5930761.1 DNA polymerase I [Halochromatium salexigens]